MSAHRERRVQIGPLEVAHAANEASVERLRPSLSARAVRLILERVGRGRHRPKASAQLGLPAAGSAAGRGDASPLATALWQGVSQVRGYHNIALPHGVANPRIGDRFGTPRNLSGKQYLDVGTCWPPSPCAREAMRGASGLARIDEGTRFPLRTTRGHPIDNVVLQANVISAAGQAH